jgi:hypothetical protein
MSTKFLSIRRQTKAGKKREKDMKQKSFCDGRRNKKNGE